MLENFNRLKKCATPVILTQIRLWLCRHIVFCMNDSQFVQLAPPGESEGVVRLPAHQGQLSQAGVGGTHYQVLGRISAPEQEDEHDDDDDDDDGDTEKYEVDKVDLVIGTEGRLRDHTEVTLYVIVVVETGASVRAEELSWRTELGVGVPAGALAGLGVPGVGGAVEAVQLVPGEVGQTLTGAGVW